MSGNWMRSGRGGPEADSLLRCLGNTPAARRWVKEAIPWLEEVETRLTDPHQPWTFGHLDLRSDNMAFRADGRLVVFDWASAGWVPAAFDAAAFCPSLSAESGQPAAKLWETYRGAARVHHINFPPGATRAAVAAVAGYFAARAGLPDIPGLPRVRTVQRLQLGRALHWAAEVLGLAPPPVLRSGAPTPLGPEPDAPGD